MDLPNLKEARKRTDKKVEVLTDSYRLTEELKKLGLNRNYYIRTYGCQMNEHDTEKNQSYLGRYELQEVENMENADLILLNTCAIREKRS